MPDSLNIPIKLMKRYCKDKSMWELFVFAVSIKLTSDDSKIPNDVKAVRKIMGCSYYKATRMIERARKCPELFFFYENDRYIVARSFTHKKLDRKTFRTNKKTYTAYCASCIRYRYEKSAVVSHIAVSRQLRDKLIKNAIRATERTDGSNTIKNSPRPSQLRPLTLRSLSAASGYHRTTVRKHLANMEQGKEVKIIKGGLRPVLHLESGAVIAGNDFLTNRKQCFDWHSFRFVREANRYFLISPAKDDYAVNIIFNHTGRHRRHDAASPMQKKNESRAGFLNRTALAYLWN